MQQLYITPAHVARKVGISADMARRYLSEDIPKTSGHRAQQRFEVERLDELAALCESKRRRRCFNRYNARLIENDGALLE